MYTADLACLIHRILHGNDLHLLHRMVGVVERLLESSDYQEETRLLGGIPLLLGLLRYLITATPLSFVTTYLLHALQ